MMRVNDVIRTSSVGASVKTVSSNRICSESATSEGFVAGVTPMLTRGIGIVGAVGPGIVCASARQADRERDERHRHAPRAARATRAAS